MKSHTGMPSFTALSERLAEMPEPRNAMTRREASLGDVDVAAVLAGDHFSLPSM
jgi:hypothetical protein